MVIPFNDKIFVAPSRVHARRFGSELVILDLTAGEYFGLDEVGADIWERASRGCPAEQIVEALLDVYDVDPTKLRADVESLMEQFVERRWLIEKREAE